MVPHERFYDLGMAAATIKKRFHRKLLLNRIRKALHQGGLHNVLFIGPMIERKLGQEWMHSFRSLRMARLARTMNLLVSAYGSDIHGGHYDKEGLPITFGEYMARSEDMEYKRVDVTDLGRAEVSTIWLGIDHNWFRKGPPVIFETMLFFEDADNEMHTACWRYATLEQAKAGHQATVDKVKLDLECEDSAELIRKLIESAQ